MGTTSLDQRTPEMIGSLLNATSVSGGAGHSLAALADGRVFSWGLNNKGQLGDGSNALRTSPVMVRGLGTTLAEVLVIVKVAAGGEHSLALLARLVTDRFLSILSFLRVMCR
jgi:alpha-tubulin suppressor-like RCC1 family protein